MQCIIVSTFLFRSLPEKEMCEYLINQFVCCIFRMNITFLCYGFMEKIFTFLVFLDLFIGFFFFVSMLGSRLLFIHTIKHTKILCSCTYINEGNVFNLHFNNGLVLISAIFIHFEREDYKWNKNCCESILVYFIV